MCGWNRDRNRRSSILDMKFKLEIGLQLEGTDLPPQTLTCRFIQHIVVRTSNALMPYMCQSTLEFHLVTSEAGIQKRIKNTGKT